MTRTHRSLLLVLAVLLSLAAAAPAAAQNYSAQKPRRQFITVSYDWMNTEALHFKEYPLEALVGRPVASAQNERYEYRTRDEQIQIDILEFRTRNRGMSATVYPFGLSSGTALGFRGSLEELPIIRIDFAGVGAPPLYSLTGAKAYDAGVGLFIADRSPGWGLGSMAFLIAGAGRIKADGREGSRVFAEGGGGLAVGPLGVQLGVKFAWNKFDDPVTHRFLTIPITLRGTFSF